MKDYFTIIKNKLSSNKFLLTLDIKKINCNSLNELKRKYQDNKIFIIFCKKNIFKKFYYCINKKYLKKCGNYLFFFNSLENFIFSNSLIIKKNFFIYRNFFFNFIDIKNFDFNILKFKDKNEIILKSFSFFEKFFFCFNSSLNMLTNEKSR
ncbi:hypothetical protein [Candidatus Vidania fulgoroideorum]